jgi:predicted negative regulator of RcsB-dependent stress response
VDDFMTERDQWDALMQWLRENLGWIIAGIVLGVGILMGWRWYQEREANRAETASARYQDMLVALDARDKTRAEELLEQLRKDYPETPYIDQAELSLARTHVENNELDKAAALLRNVMTESRDEELQHVAALRLARVQIAQNKPDDALATLKRPDAGAFDPRYAEIRGDALVAKGDRAGALAEYRKAQAAASAPGAEPGLVDAGLLQLKINDLAAPGEDTQVEAATGGQDKTGSTAAPENQDSAQ